MLQYHSHALQAMGSRCEFLFYAKAGDELKINSILENRLRAIEAKYSRYRDDSVTSQINMKAGTGQSQSIDKETYGLLTYAQALYEQSDGLFDITSGILRQVWNFHSNQLPSSAAISTRLPLINWPSVIWSESIVKLPQKGMELDFGGFVKEFAADQLAGLLLKMGIRHGLVNLGGDIVVIGPHPDGSAWMVGVQHPRKVGEAIMKVPMKKGAIATSGDYERFMMVDGKRYCHILNPKTGVPIQPPYAGVSVIADQCLIAGSFSTIALLRSEAEPHWLKDTGVHYLLVDQAMHVQVSPN